jgi:hypothetical protein
VTKEMGRGGGEGLLSCFSVLKVMTIDRALAAFHRPLAYGRLG